MFLCHVWGFLYLRYISRKKVTGWRRHNSLIFFDLSKVFYKILYHLKLPQAVDERNYFCIQYWLSNSDFSLSIGVKWHQFILFCISLTTGKVKHLTIGMLANQVSFYKNSLLISITLFKGTGSCLCLTAL